MAVTDETKYDHRTTKYPTQRTSTQSSITIFAKGITSWAKLAKWAKWTKSAGINLHNWNSRCLALACLASASLCSSGPLHWHAALFGLIRALPPLFDILGYHAGQTGQTMPNRPKIIAIVPAYNEAPAIAEVVTHLCALLDESGAPMLAQVIVADNNSNDDTGLHAAAAGATVVRETRQGYGYACMAGIRMAFDADILLFVDGDHSVEYREIGSLLAPLYSGADLVIGARRHVDSGAMTFPQRFGNALACSLARWLWRVPMTDLGPLRAITRPALLQIDMQDMTFGWTIEMQLRAFELGQQVVEVPVSLHCRLGHSKISGTIRGVVGAAIGIFAMIGRLWWRGYKKSRQIR